jgi:hypothetical protein
MWYGDIIVLIYDALILVPLQAQVIVVVVVVVEVENLNIIGCECIV